MIILFVFYLVVLVIFILQEIPSLIEISERKHCFAPIKVIETSTGPLLPSKKCCLTNTQSDTVLTDSMILSKIAFLYYFATVQCSLNHWKYDIFFSEILGLLRHTTLQTSGKLCNQTCSCLQCFFKSIDTLFNDSILKLHSLHLSSFLS